jgi:hypothetical protein
VDVGAEVAPDYTGIGYLLRAVVRTTAVVIVAGGRFASVLKTEVGRAGRAVDKDRRLKLDGTAISKVLVHQLINDGLLHVAPVGLKVEPIRADIMGARVVGIFDGSKRDWCMAERGRLVRIYNMIYEIGNTEYVCRCQ